MACDFDSLRVQAIFPEAQAYLALLPRRAWKTLHHIWGISICQHVALKSTTLQHRAVSEI
jgi:hypothetical protein